MLRCRILVSIFVIITSRALHINGANNHIRKHADSYGIRLYNDKKIIRTRPLRRLETSHEEYIKLDFAADEAYVMHLGKPGALDRPEKNARIVDGTAVPIGRYPYLVALFEKDPLTGKLTHMCGGSLIAPDRVLTAAHCVPNTNVVITGIYDYQRVAPGSYERFDLISTDFIIHPSYSPKTMDQDFALIKLNRQSRFSTVRLNFDEYVPEGTQQMTVMGWGYERNYGVTTVAQEAVLDHVNLSICREKWGYDTIKSSMVCATGYGKVDTCQGDSGGPMILKGTDDTSDVLIGLTSWGAGCSDATYPGVYARVSSVEEWLKSLVPYLTPNSPITTTTLAVPTTPIVPTPSVSNPTPAPPVSNPTPAPPVSDPTPTTPVSNPTTDTTCVEENCWNLIVYLWCDTICN